MVLAEVIIHIFIGNVIDGAVQSAHPGLLALLLHLRREPLVR